VVGKMTVSFFFLLCLKVFKRIRIYRTETGEETQEFLSRFGAQESREFSHCKNKYDIHDFLFIISPEKPVCLFSNSSPSDLVFPVFICY
jgi:hypothetical protein